MGAEGEAEAEEEKAESHGELPAVLQQLVGPVVHDAGDKGLNVAELTVDAEDKEHHKEDGGPDDGAGEGEDEVRVGEEDEAGAGVDHVVDGGAGDESHVAEDGEDEDPRQQAGRGVHDAGDDGVPDRPRVIYRPCWDDVLGTFGYYSELCHGGKCKNVHRQSYMPLTSDFWPSPQPNRPANPFWIGQHF